MLICSLAYSFLPTFVTVNEGLLHLKPLMTLQIVNLSYNITKDSSIKKKHAVRSASFLLLFRLGFLSEVSVLQHCLCIFFAVQHHESSLP